MILDEENFDAVKLQSATIIDIEKFVPRQSIDRLYWDAPYHVFPDGKTGIKASVADKYDTPAKDVSYPVDGYAGDMLSDPVFDIQRDLEQAAGTDAPSRPASARVDPEPRSVKASPPCRDHCVAR